MPTLNEWINGFGWFEGILALSTIVLIVVIRETSSIGIFRRKNAKQEEIKN